MRRSSAIVMVIVALLVSISGVAQAQKSGLKLAEKLTNRAEQVNSAIRSTNLELKKTLEHYNYIVDGKAEDPRAEYKSLTKEMDKCLKSRDNVRSNAAAMQAAADKYFANWEASQAGYSSEDMRAKSEARLAETKANYAKILEAGGKAGADFDEFIAQLGDQVRFLGLDLSPSAIAELTDEAAALNKQADTLFNSITETLKTSADYTAKLAPQ
jgi:hypothetical protein